MLTYRENLLDVYLKASLFLLRGLKDFVSRKIEIERPARMASVLLRAGANGKSKVFLKLREQILVSQKDDGGWRNVEESLWCLDALRQMDCMGDGGAIDKGYNWLDKQRSEQGCWGQNSRDCGRIPLTSLIVILHPDLCNMTDIEWLIKAVEEEVFNAPVYLTYKVSLPIIALKTRAIASNPKNRWTRFLIEQQNDDGGFGPWKQHPIGSDIISTSYAAISIADQERYRAELSMAIGWICSTQLDDGSWPYHYIDHGTSMGLFAVNELLQHIDHQTEVRRDQDAM